MEEILRSFSGVARLMAGKPAGLKRLDLSADGFWNSFGAILVALPPTILAWIEYETVERAEPRSGTGDLGVYGAHALADLTAWLFPILILASLARPLGLARKLTPLVVSLNWGSALLAWALTPLWLLLLIAGPMDGLGSLVTLVAVVAATVLTMRLAATAIGADLIVGAGIVALTLASALVAYVAVADLTGIALV